LVYGAFGITWAYGIACAFLFISFVLLVLIKDRPIAAPTVKETLKESLMTGIRFVFQNEVILGALSLDLFAVFFGGAVALLPFFSDKILHVGPQGLGLLRAAPAIGAVLMAVVLAYWPQNKNAGRNLLVCVAGFGLCMVLFAISTNFILSMALLILSGMFDNVSVVIRGTILQVMTPDHMRGRVSSVNSIFIGSSNEIGALESGIAAKLMGIIPSVIFGGIMTMVVVGVTTKKAPELRTLDISELQKKEAEV
jgi:MFS family permease